MSFVAGKVKLEPSPSTVAARNSDFLATLLVELPRGGEENRDVPASSEQPASEELARGSSPKPRHCPGIPTGQLSAWLTEVEVLDASTGSGGSGDGAMEV